MDAVLVKVSTGSGSARALLPPGPLTPRHTGDGGGDRGIEYPYGRSKSRRLTAPNAKSVKIWPGPYFGAAVFARLQNSQTPRTPGVTETSAHELRQNAGEKTYIRQKVSQNLP